MVLESIHGIIHRMLFLFETIKLVKNWNIAFTLFFENKPNTSSIKLRNGLKFYINGNILDLKVIVENFGRENKYDYFMRTKNTKVIIIDIGANIGAFSIFAAKKYPKSRIFSYEPDEKNFEKLKKNLSVNGIENVKIFNYAVGKDNGKMFLFSNLDGSFGTVGSSTIEEGPIKKEVQSINLENILKINKIDFCDLLKLDCEGAEYDILYSSNKETFDKIDLISLEYHNLQGHKGTNLEVFLKNLGYDVKLFTNKNNKKFGFIYAYKLSK